MLAALRAVKISAPDADDILMEDHEYLVSYEYGHGKAWAVVFADSADDIVAAAPDLDVVTEPPVTMSPRDLAALRARPVGLDSTLVQSVLDRRLA